MIQEIPDQVRNDSVGFSSTASGPFPADVMPNSRTRHPELDSGSLYYMIHEISDQIWNDSLCSRITEEIADGIMLFKLSGTKIVDGYVSADLSSQLKS